MELKRGGCAYNFCKKTIDGKPEKRQTCAVLNQDSSLKVTNMIKS
jgi:hypothetical protein